MTLLLVHQRSEQTGRIIERYKPVTYNNDTYQLCHNVHIIKYALKRP